MRITNSTTFNLARDDYEVSLIKDILDYLREYKSKFIEITYVTLRTNIEQYKNVKGYSFDVYNNLISIEFGYLFDITKCEKHIKKIDSDCEDDDLFELFSEDIEKAENELLWDLQEKFKIEV